MVVDIRRLTVEKYHRMGEMGIFDPDEHVELVDGQIIKKPVKGASHSAAVARTNRLLHQRLGEQVLVRLQAPITLDNYSEPEPDIAVVKPDPLYYEEQHPTPSEVYLVVEIADKTLKSDREFKAQVYAHSGIIDYWILDTNNRRLYILREPSENGYQNQLILLENTKISLSAFPKIIFKVGEMLRPL